MLIISYILWYIRLRDSSISMLKKFQNFMIFLVATQFFKKAGIQTIMTPALFEYCKKSNIIIKSSNWSYSSIIGIIIKET
jgi:sialic acid synthase SpsE